jgi:hypothetical protein
MAGIVNGQPVDQTASNAAWLAKNGDDTAIGKISLQNADASASGAFISNVQRELNGLNAFTGKASNASPTGTPAWVNNDVGAPTDDLMDRADALTEKFNDTTGHNHDGTAGNGAPIDADTIAGVTLMGYFLQGTDLIGVTGTSTDVSTELLGKSPSTGPTVQGVVVNAPYNRVTLRKASGPDEGDQFIDGSGNVVYARVTEAVGVWTLSYYSLIAGVETAYNFAVAADVRWYYQELYNPIFGGPVYDPMAFIPSDNVTADVLTATTAIQGKVQLATVAQSVGSANSAGTANATVANADHVHQGVHSIAKTGDTALYGDVEFEGLGGTVITRVGNKLQINTSSGIEVVQEELAGVRDGINDTFGPLSDTPISTESIIVWIDGVKQKETEWSLSGSDIVFTTPPGVGVDPIEVYYLTAGVVLGSTVSPKTEYRTISAGEATAKALTLSNSPSISGEVNLDVIGGGPQFYGDDFIVSGSTLDWNGLGLDGLLAAGDKLRISYFY